MIEATEAYGLTFEFPARDTAVGASLRDHGEFARPELDFLIASAGATDGAFVDVGANLGAISLPFAAARPAWRVIAVEAFFAMAQLLERNARGNNLSNVEVLAVAAGAEAGVGDFPAAELRHGGNFGALGFYSTETTLKRRVGIRPLDDFAPPDTRIVKVDVEGYEPQVLSGAVTTLRQVRPLWILEAHPSRAEALAAIRSTFAAAEYSLFWFFSPFATPASPKARPQDITRGDYGLVAVPAGQEPAWPLPSANGLSAPPGAAADFPYLKAYGY